MPFHKTPSLRPRCPTWKAKEAKIFDRCRWTHMSSANVKTRNLDRRAATWISELCRRVSSAGGFSSALNLWSHRLTRWHTYPPLNDFSSSPASHLIRVESLMPFGDLSAFSRIHCHYENERRQLKAQMFFCAATERLLMCLVIFAFAASDERPSLETRLIVFRISHLTFGPHVCSLLAHSSHLAPTREPLIEIIIACWNQRRQRLMSSFSEDPNETRTVKLIIECLHHSNMMLTCFSGVPGV